MTSSERPDRSRAPRQHAQERLAAQLSGNRCAFPGCRELLSAPQAGGSRGLNLGQLAHIQAERPGGARHDQAMTARQRGSADNLILLCTPHHTLVDGQRERFTADALRSMKREHEQWVHQRLSEAAGDLSFVELEVVARYFQGNSAAPTESLTLTAPARKIAKNGLGESTARLIVMGLASASIVAGFLDQIGVVDAGFVDRLISGFKAEYSRLAEMGLAPDELFAALQEFAAGESDEFIRQAAGLAILAYLFERCEVFEP